MAEPIEIETTDAYVLREAAGAIQDVQMRIGVATAQYQRALAALMKELDEAEAAYAVIGRAIGTKHASALAQGQYTLDPAIGAFIPMKEKS